MTAVTRAGEHLAEAISLQFHDVEDDERQSRVKQLLNSHRSGDIRIDDSLIIRRSGLVIGAQLLIVQNDGTLYVWPAVTDPRVAPYDATPLRRALYAEAVRIVDASSAWIAQSLLESDDEDASDEMHQNGFSRLTRLLFMNRPLNSPVPAVEQRADCRLIPYDSVANRDRFERAIERSYSGTLDCPELNGCRSGDQALAGHQLSGQFHPERWLLLSYRGQDAGLLLMTEHPEEQVWEIVYFGLLPEFRGLRLGRHLLQVGLHRARKANAQELVLAVDERNEPAIRLYKALDFMSFDQRIVHARLAARR